MKKSSNGSRAWMFAKSPPLFAVLLALLVIPQAAHSNEGLSGKWEGMFHCYGVNFLFDMDVNVEGENTISARLEAEPVLMGRQGINWRPKYVNTKLHGQFIPELSIFRLNSSNVANDQWFDFVGVVEPGTGQMSAHVKSRSYGSCSYLVGARKAPNKIIKPVIRNAKYTPARTNSNGLGPRQCDADIQNWLKQLDTFPEQIRRDKLKYATLTLFQDEYFRPIFGSTFEKTSKSRLAKINYQIQSGCRNAIQSQTARSVLAQIGVVLDNNAGLSRAEVFMHPATKRIVKNWSLWAKKTIHQQGKLGDMQFDFFTKAANEATQILWPTESVDFQAEVEIAKRHNRTQQFLADIRHQIAAGFKSIQQFSQLSNAAADKTSGAISSEGIQQSHELIGEAINKNVVKITKAFVADQTGLSELNNLHPVEGNPVFSQFVHYLSAENKRQANLLLSARRRNLIRMIADSEFDAFSQEKHNVGGELSVLENLVHYENSLDRKYGKLLEESDFAKFNAIRSDYRERLFNKHRDQIILLIKGSDKPDQVYALVKKFASQKDPLSFSLLQNIATSRHGELRTQNTDYCDSQANLARSVLKLRMSGQTKDIAMLLVQGLDGLSMNVVDYVYGMPIANSREEEKRYFEGADKAMKEKWEDLAASRVMVGCLKRPQ